jgi:hypothetical protein
MIFHSLLVINSGAQRVLLYLISGFTYQIDAIVAKCEVIVLLCTLKQ